MFARHRFDGEQAGGQDGRLAKMTANSSSVYMGAVMVCFLVVKMVSDGLYGSASYWRPSENVFGRTVRLFRRPRRYFGQASCRFASHQ